MTGDKQDAGWISGSSWECDLTYIDNNVWLQVLSGVTGISFPSQLWCALYSCIIDHHVCLSFSYLENHLSHRPKLPAFWCCFSLLAGIYLSKMADKLTQSCDLRQPIRSRLNIPELQSGTSPNNRRHSSNALRTNLFLNLWSLREAVERDCRCCLTADMQVNPYIKRLKTNLS